MSRYHISGSDSWSNPPPHRDACTRFQKHGPILPMEVDDPRSPVMDRLIVAVGLILLIVGGGMVL